MCEGVGLRGKDWCVPPASETNVLCCSAYCVLPRELHSVSLYSRPCCCRRLFWLHEKARCAAAAHFTDASAALGASVTCVSVWRLFRFVSWQGILHPALVGPLC